MLRNNFSKFFLAVVFANFFINYAEALQIDLIGPCDQATSFSVVVDLKNQDIVSLGDLTVKVLNENQIPYKGSAQGVSQIYNSPIGDQALEVLNATQMRAYGWCVHVDDNEPYEMPDKVMITSAVKKITWFYAYSFYDNGTWKDYCTPAWKEHSLGYCKKP